MHRTPILIAAFAALALALSPGVAEARAGFGSSFGSRGSMTWSAPPATRTAPYAAQPMQRSLMPNSPSRGYGGMPGYGYRARSPFMSGLMGGLIGAGIGGLLFGHGFWGGGLGIFGFLGFLLQIFLLVWLARFLIRLFRGQSPVFAGGPNIFARGSPPGPGATPLGGGHAAQPIAIGTPDYQAFEQLLQAIQAAWTAHDLNGLRAMVTPEMLSYFGEQLAEQESRGLRNEVRDVRLLQGDLAQAWTEGGRDYATVAMRFSMTDVTRDMTGRVVDGSTTEHVTATELWTFLRASGGGHWILSAIQQTR
ncbi:MAG TPA: TIM44-like domain-containing protein [Acetobacteraceae bacterium]|nr:TIM44-like domain-containing protein [Acetobacteraceae bacterium]